MQKTRVRITPIYTSDNQISYTDVEASSKHGWSGWLGTQYLPKGKFEEMVRNGFAYTNQYKHFIV